MIYLGLGSNLGDRESTICRAINLLCQHPAIRLIKASSLYETAPVGFTDQADFLNAVISIETSLTPTELLGVCQSVEAKLGRVRKQPWGPRTIDVDILIYNDLQCATSTLILPHPRFHQRRFVLVPLAEIAGNQPLYNGLSADELLRSCPPDEVKFFKAICSGGKND